MVGPASPPPQTRPSGIPGIDAATVERIVSAAVAEDVHCVGLSILSGAHNTLCPRLIELLREKQMADVPVVVGGIIPEEDRPRLASRGVAAIYTPKDFDIARIMREVAELAVAHRKG